MMIGFEEAFTAAQADYISLCLELVQDDVDTVYGFIFQASGASTFNVFFGKNGEIKTLDDIASRDLIAQFFRVGREDIRKLLEICTRYEHKCPNQIKMIYHTKTKQFDANYVYMEPAEIEEASPASIFMDWMDEEEDKLLGT